MQPITAVLLDFHHTLVGDGDLDAWVETTWAGLGREGTARGAWGEQRHPAMLDFLHRVWQHAATVDPESRRDLDDGAHARVWAQTVERFAPVDDPELTDALYATLPSTWTLYDETIELLQGLRDRQVRVALLSNIGMDLRPLLVGYGIDRLLDAVVMSYEVGHAKPDREIFEAALSAVGAPAEQTLMVGDSWWADAGAAALGIRTLLLPPQTGTTHGLGLVTALVDASRG